MIYLNMIVGALTAILSGLGVGGGGLLVIYLTLVLNIPQLRAQGMNLTFYLFASASALAYHCKKHTVDWKTVLISSFFGIIGSLLGTWLADIADPLWVRKVFGAFLTFSGGAGLIKLIMTFIKERRNAK